LTGEIQSFSVQATAAEHISYSTVLEINIFSYFTRIDPKVISFGIDVIGSNALDYVLHALSARLALARGSECYGAAGHALASSKRRYFAKRCYRVSVTIRYNSSCMRGMQGIGEACDLSAVVNMDRSGPDGFILTPPCGQLIPLWLSRLTAAIVVLAAATSEQSAVSSRQNY
jgi:hypothetical protein